jgi:hypothetical protein
MPLDAESIYVAVGAIVTAIAGSLGGNHVIQRRKSNNGNGVCAIHHKTTAELMKKMEECTDKQSKRLDDQGKAIFDMAQDISFIRGMLEAK